MNNHLSGFFSFRNFFSDNTRVRIFIFQEFNIRLYDKTSESDYYFFPPPKSVYFFSNIWNQNMFLEKKNDSPTLEVKWSVPLDGQNRQRLPMPE